MIRRTIAAALVAAGAVLLGAGPVRAQIPHRLAPVNTAPPLVSGKPIAGSRLSSDDGAWTGLVLRWARYWQRLDGRWWFDVDGASGSSYEIAWDDVGHRLRFCVAAVGITATVDACSQPTPPVAPRIVYPPVATPTPTPTSTPTPAASPSPAPVPTIPSPSPSAEPLIAWPAAVFRSSGLSTTTLRWGERSAIVGTLTRPDGRPVAGARVSVASRLDMLSARPVGLGSIRTDPGGSFSYTPPVGPSRTITFGFTDAVALRTATVTLKVLPRVTVRFARGAIQGRVAGAPAGLRPLVELQMPGGGSWRTFAATRLARAGGTFSFQTRNPPRTVRALIRADPDWPFLTGTSPPVIHRR